MNRAFIFDMDGVIFDSERLYIECSLEASAELGLPQEGVIELCHRCIGVTPERTRQIMMETYHDPAVVDAFRGRTVSLFLEKYNAGQMDVKPGAEELLKFLKQQGYPLAIASSTPTEIVRQELSAAGLLDYFDRIVGGDQVSRSKPNPDIFLRAAELLRTEPSRCIVIEDSFNGIRAAKAAGMTAVMVPDQLQPDEEIKALADRIELSLLHVLQELRSAAELPAET
jgi:HAD superfamily hydrolase (TIGR01509 family)